MAEPIGHREYNPFTAEIDQELDRILAGSEIIDGLPGERVHNIREADGLVNGGDANIVLGYTPDNQRRIHLTVTYDDGLDLLTDFFEYFPERSQLKSWSIQPTGLKGEPPDLGNYSNREESLQAIRNWMADSLLGSLNESIESHVAEDEIGLANATSIEDWEKFRDTLVAFHFKPKPRSGWLARLLGVKKK